MALLRSRPQQAAVWGTAGLPLGLWGASLVVRLGEWREAWQTSTGVTGSVSALWLVALGVAFEFYVFRLVNERLRVGRDHDERRAVRWDTGLGLAGFVLFALPAVVLVLYTPLLSQAIHGGP